MRVNRLFLTLPVALVLSVGVPVSTAPAGGQAAAVATLSDGIALSAPESVGFSSDSLKELDTAMQGIVDAKHLAGVVMLVARHGKVVQHKAYGLQDVATHVDADALERGDVTRFEASLENARRELAPIGAFAKRFTLFLDANAHIDAAWLWRERETVEVCRNTFASVMNMFAARPDFTYTQSSAAYYDWIERRDPALFQKIRDMRGRRRNSPPSTSCQILLTSSTLVKNRWPPMSK